MNRRHPPKIKYKDGREARSFIMVNQHHPGNHSMPSVNKRFWLPGMLWYLGIAFACLCTSALLFYLSIKGNAALLWSATAFGGSVLALWMVYHCWRDKDDVAVLLFFEKSIPGGGNDYDAGKIICRNLDALDDAARRADRAPLSSFGFVHTCDSDLVWQPASEGLRTVSALVAALHTLSPGTETGLAAIAGDERELLAKILTAWQHRLECAAGQEVGFRLTVRGDAVSGLDVERRKGCL